MNKEDGHMNNDKIGDKEDQLEWNMATSAIRTG
jgi:hypothetical protein